MSGEHSADSGALTSDQRQRFLEAAEAPLKVRRNVLRMAAHMTGHHKHPHGESCEECREKWPCVPVLRAAGPILNAVADLPSQYDIGREWAAIRLSVTRPDTEFWRGYRAALNDIVQLAGQPNADPTYITSPGDSA